MVNNDNPSTIVENIMIMDSPGCSSAQEQCPSKKSVVGSSPIEGAIFR